MDESNKDSKAVYFFGKDVSQLPCFRNTFIYGTGTGATVALMHFMFTSTVRRSLLVGYGSFFVSSISYWFYCTYNFSKQRFELLRMQHLIKEKLLKEGTKDDFQLGVPIAPQDISESDKTV